MNTLTKAMAVAILHILIVLSLGGKLLYDRQTCPRVWVRTGSFDPDLPIRGRYMALRLQVQAPWLQGKEKYSWTPVALDVENGLLVARPAGSDTGLSVSSWLNQRTNRPNQPPRDVAFLDQSVLFFLPEHAEVARLKPGEELWAEVTVPRKGPPRPIQLALMRGTEWVPLNYR
jgi:hypothetical protein